MHGTYKFWHDNGQLAKEAEYRENKVVPGSEKAWDRTGKEIPYSWDGWIIWN